MNHHRFVVVVDYYLHDCSFYSAKWIRSTVIASMSHWTIDGIAVIELILKDIAICLRQAIMSHFFLCISFSLFPSVFLCLKCHSLNIIINMLLIQWPAIMLIGHCILMIWNCFPSKWMSITLKTSNRINEMLKYTLFTLYMNLSWCTNTHTPTQENGTEYDMCF